MPLLDWSQCPAVESVAGKVSGALFDNGTPKPIARALPGHDVTYARRIGWHELDNGDLIQRDIEIDIPFSRGCCLVASTGRGRHW